MRLVHLSSFHLPHKYFSRKSNKVKRKLVNLEAPWALRVCKLMMYFSCASPQATVCRHLQYTRRLNILFPRSTSRARQRSKAVGRTDGLGVRQGCRPASEVEDNRGLIVSFQQRGQPHARGDNAGERVGSWKHNSELLARTCWFSFTPDVWNPGILHPNGLNLILGSV